MKQPLKWEHAILIPLSPSPSPADQLDIEIILDMLHTRYPEADYPRYKNQLWDHGVDDLADVLKFDAAFYANTVGMEYGLGYLLCRWAGLKMNSLKSLS